MIEVCCKCKDCSTVSNYVINCSNCNSENLDKMIPLDSTDASLEIKKLIKENMKTFRFPAVAKDDPITGDKP